MIGDLFEYANVFTGRRVTAYGAEWIVCNALHTRADGDVLALAVRASAVLPCLPEVILYTPEEEVERRERRARCAATGHVLRDRESMWGGKMVRYCECYENKQEREPTAEEWNHP